MPISSTIRNLQTLLDDTSEPNFPGAFPTKQRRISSKRPSLSGLFSSKESAASIKEPLDEWQDALPPSPLQAQASTSKFTLDVEALDEAVNAVFYQAGTTEDGLPLLVLSPCNLPRDASRVNDILDRLMLRIEPYVSTAYVLIFFASPTSANLSTAMLVQRYLALPRTAKKNIQKLYTVHPGFWTKMILKLFVNGIVSSKVGKKGKLKAIPTLSELASEVDITLYALSPSLQAVD